MRLRALASPAWAMLEYGWYPLLLLIGTPWFLRQLGPGQYGNWMLLTATVGFGGILNSGTGVATVKAVSAGMGPKGLSQEGESQIRVSIAIAMIGGGALALLVLSVFWFGGTTWLGRMGEPGVVQLTGIAAAVLIWIEQLDNVFSSVIKGAERFGQAAKVEMSSKTIQVGGAALILGAWPSLFALYIFLFVVAVLRLCSKVFIAKRLLQLKTLRPSLAGGSSILHFAKWGWLQGLGVVLFSVADRMLVGSLLGATSLAYYSIASQLAMQVHAIAAAGLSVIFPMVSRRLSANAAFSLWGVTKLTMAGNFLLSSVLACGFIIWGPYILRVWLGPATAGPIGQVLPWLVAAYWLLALNVVPYYILLGMGRIRFVGITILASGIAGVGAMYLAIANVGFAGAPFGRGVYALICLVLIWPLARHFLAERRGVSTLSQSSIGGGSEGSPPL